jgi:Flp pilus assembly pilin Flp
LFALRTGGFWRNQRGASSIEYALLASLIAVFCAILVAGVGLKTFNLHMLVCGAVAAATGNPPC